MSLTCVLTHICRALAGQGSTRTRLLVFIPSEFAAFRTRAGLRRQVWRGFHSTMTRQKDGWEYSTRCRGDKSEFAFDLRGIEIRNYRGCFTRRIENVNFNRQIGN